MAANLSIVAHVACDGDCLMTGTDQFLYRGLSRLFFEVYKHHGGACLCEGIGSGSPHTGTAAGDESNLSFEVVDRIHPSALTHSEDSQLGWIVRVCAYGTDSQLHGHS
jgi:hypothetical protein